MNTKQALDNWKKSLPSNISHSSLFSRNPIAHKWKAPFRSAILRECTFWRLHDLLTQAHALHNQNHYIGSCILIRSGYETLATLIYLNQLMEKVVNESLDFHEFCRKTSILLLGSRNKTTKHDSTSILTILEKCEKKYSGIINLYADLSEIAHPNFDGVCMGYSKISEDMTTFSNLWDEHYMDPENLISVCMKTFEQEYNVVWTSNFAKLEEWIKNNDQMLESTK